MKDCKQGEDCPQEKNAETAFAERLKGLRKESELKQLQLAKVLGTTQRKISYWESGKIQPDLSSLCKIADVFDVSIDYLLGRKEY